MRLDVFADMTNDALKIHLQALRLRDKLLKGPWMALFHADDNQRNHFDQVARVQNAISFIGCVLGEPDFVLLSKHDAFGRSLNAA
nr:hypothetical protein BgiMline_027707 [Biomphalaria glabrata]